jgi:hypothetical protein
MNFGAGGANVSIDNLAAAFKGAMVWNKNNKIAKFVNNVSTDPGYAANYDTHFDFENEVMVDQDFDISDYIAESNLSDNTDSSGITDIRNEEPLANSAGIDYANDNVDNNNSSIDCWRITMNADGTVENVLLGGDYTVVTIIDADGNERTLTLQEGSLSEALAVAVGNGITKKQMNDIMVSSGLDFNTETSKWYDKNGASDNLPPVPTEVSTDLNPGFSQNTLTDTQNVLQSALNGIINGVNKITSFIGGIFGKNNNITVDTSAQKPGNTFTIKNSNGEEFNLFNLDLENPALDGLLSQHDPAFASIPAIKNDGCNFLAILAFVQLVTGTNLTAEQQMDIWNDAVKKPSTIMNSEGFVYSRSLLADLALDKLGITNIGLSFDNPKSNVESTLIGYRLQVPYGKNGTHFIITNLSQQLLWNPGNTTNDKNKIFIGVYVYARN